MTYKQKDVISPYSLKGNLTNVVVTRPCFSHTYIPFEVEITMGTAYAKYDDPRNNRPIASGGSRRDLICAAKRFITEKVNKYCRK